MIVICSSDQLILSYMKPQVNISHLDIFFLHLHTSVQFNIKLRLSKVQD